MKIDAACPCVSQLFQFPLFFLHQLFWQNCRAHVGFTTTNQNIFCCVKGLRKIKRRVSEDMPSKNRFRLSTEMKSTTGVIKNCLQQMKNCCEQEIPFHPATEMESVIDVTEDCLEQMKDCSKLTERLGKLESYKRKRNTTKIMLLLIEYGSEDNFANNIKSTILKFGGRLKDLKRYVTEIEKMSLAKSTACTTCKGTGKIVRFRVIRERGSQQYSVRQVTPCSNCSGLGQVPMEEELLESVTLFLEKAKKLPEILGKFHQSLSDLTSDSFKRIQALEREELVISASLHKKLETKPLQREEPKIVMPTREKIAKIFTTMPKTKKFSWPYPKEHFLNLLNLKRVKPYYSPAPDGTPTWWERRANRRYTCSTCKKPIEKGERYIGRKELKPGMRGPYGYRGTYTTDYYHITCLLKSSQAQIEKKIRNAHSRISGLKGEITTLRDQTHSKRLQIENCKTLTQKARRDYQDASLWRKIDKWINYRYVSWSKAGEISRLEKEITHIDHREIPDREAEISRMKKRISKLKSWLSKIKREHGNLLRAGVIPRL